jgi:hypothetical protein
MIFSENNAYGWGPSKIAMPRAALEPRPRRRPETGGFVLPGGPDGTSCRWRPLPVSGTFLADCPWRQFLSLAILSLMIIAYFHLLNRTLPGYQTEQPPKPVEIVIAMQKTEVVPDEQRPEIAPTPVTVAKEAGPEPIDGTPPKLAMEKPKEIATAMLKKQPLEPDIPTVQVKSQVLLKKTREPRRIASIKPDIVKPQKPANINIPPPKVRRRSYVKKDSDKILQPHQVRQTTHLSPAANAKFNEDIDVGGPRTVFKSYPLLAETQTAPSDTAPLVSFQAPRNTKIGNLKLKQTNRQTGPPLPTALPETAQDLVFTSSGTADTRLSLVARADRRYTIVKTDRPQLQAAQSTNREITFQSQNKKKSLTLAMPVSNRLIGKVDRSVADHSDVTPKASDFAATAFPAELDPEHLISLQAFNVCKDPQREFRQKTLLAAQLLGPTRVESDGVVFFIKYAESGYTIEIHLYNPHGRSFKNRCEVLELALKRIVNRTN